MQLMTSNLVRRRTAAFSFIEVLVASAICGIMFLTLYAGFSSGFVILQLSRENLRGTQILQEKLETIRPTTGSAHEYAFVPEFRRSFYPREPPAESLILASHDCRHADDEMH
jgi:hypothetical protein